MKLSIGVGILALACTTLSCSKGGEPPKAAETESNTAPPPSEAPECVDENNEVQQCETDADCCKGFVCGKDPEQTHRLKFCMYAG